MHKGINLILILISLCGASVASAQTRDLDSLYHVLENHPQHDSVRVRTLTRICYLEYSSYPERNKVHAEEALNISKEIHFTKGEGLAHKYIASYYRGIGDHGQA